VVDIKPGSPKAGPLEEPVIHSKPAPDLAQVTAKLDSVATRVDAVLKDVQDGKGTLPKLLKDDDIYNDLKSASADTKRLVKNLDETTTVLRGDAQKTLKAVNESVDAIHGELDGVKTFARSGQEAVTAIKQDAEAVKALPIVQLRGRFGRATRPPGLRKGPRRLLAGVPIRAQHFRADPGGPRAPQPVRYVAVRAAPEEV